MNESPISITTAFAGAWERMKNILFRPFDLAKWFVIGFTAWLAGLAGGGSGGSSSLNWEMSGSSGSEGLERVASGVEDLLRPDTWQRWGRWILDHPFWLTAGILGCGLGIALALVILWLTSRGKFMFLDNVAHNRAEVARPWKQYRRLANSHFAFQLVFIAVMMVFASGAVLTIVGIATGGAGSGFAPPLSHLVLAGVVLLTLAAAVTIAYLQYFLDGFVVPLMHRYDLTVLAAWSRFGALFRSHPWALLLSGPFLVVLGLVVAAVVLTVGLMTCCIGFLPLLIPYIGTVILLPVPVTYRAFTVELLEQMDPGYFPDEPPAQAEEPPSVPPAPPAPPPAPAPPATPSTPGPGDP